MSQNLDKMIWDNKFVYYPTGYLFLIFIYFIIYKILTAIKHESAISFRYLRSPGRNLASRREKSPGQSRQKAEQAKKRARGFSSS